MKTIVMSFIVMLVTFSIALVSCEPQKPTPKEVYPQYVYETDKYIPDSMRMHYAEWVKNTVAAASNHMTGGDYEDPEDVIEQAEETGKRIFQVQTEGLRIVRREGQWGEFVPKERLTEEELVILEKLKR